MRKETSTNAVIQDDQSILIEQVTKRRFSSIEEAEKKLSSKRIAELFGVTLPAYFLSIGAVVEGVLQTTDGVASKDWGKVSGGISLICFGGLLYVSSIMSAVRSESILNQLKKLGELRGPRNGN